MTQPETLPLAEILPCPNPECRNPCKLGHTSGKHPWYFVRCTLPETGKLHCCDYRGPQAMSKDEAIRLHNIVCTHQHGPGLCVDCDDSGPIYSDTQIKYMVDRFLGWRLPENFTPDAGISFKRTFNEHLPVPMKHEPVGTNLFDASQATEMVRYMVEGMPGSPAHETQAVDRSPVESAPALAPLEKLREMTMADDVPSGYSPECQYAWKAGWNACVGYITGKRELPQDVADRLSAIVKE